jgi:Tol biopolymer transport system component
MAFAGFGVNYPAISRQGSMAYSVGPHDTDVWRLELDDTGRAAKPATKLIVSTRIDHTPEYSPDGRRIAFHIATDWGLEICVVNTDGSGLRQLTRNDSLDAAPDWQPAAALRD